ncbi:hypothetical protein [Xanthomonas translucens]|nr:hypothetical protein [Xanthomonas translucens]
MKEACAKTLAPYRAAAFFVARLRGALFLAAVFFAPVLPPVRRAFDRPMAIAASAALSRCRSRSSAAAPSANSSGRLATLANAMAELGEDAFDDSDALLATARMGIAASLAAYLGSAAQTAHLLDVLKRSPS